MRDDREWVEQVLAGDKQAYAHLVNKYKNKVYALLIGMGLQPQDAQDMAQESFIKAYKRLGSFDKSRSFSSWLYKIAVNCCLDEWKRKKKDIFEGADVPQIDLVSPEAMYLRKEEAEELLNHIGHLPEKYRLVLMLRYTDHLSYSEIADVLDIPLGTVQNHLHRAKKKLKEQIVEKKTGGKMHEVCGI
ncbi:RNA polymerase sigma factor [Aneurinibacillus tyrosinisolvens]|uniref:RNA polymerase sigma factor n=1 Tax=Aneurinibacillus tyrosinisolvens TaxID=1443435 RepID=UPI00063F2160|nr:sigma-70 family RNA polymerase sigma factor [Aneurinibacillus tyrosinisolvens]